MIAYLIDFIDWLLGRKERRAEREAYLEALRSMAEVSKAQSEMLTKWFESLQTQAEAASKGWTMDDRAQYFAEMEKERPEVFSKMPADVKGDPFAMEAWLNEELLKI